ncbi:hypothetical protein [Methylovirgula sp. HY1]|uniref:hypothetical protein n=1 Tax=Methylovirgula sp. HY1 TaxID=2822761 RepID=UPI001C5B08E0|nr:hypothetical protein [Methylovirgula sp. HY1]QXX73574.1 hypothetical protein MHY1_00370 [Methylovirgula sp. HY1]
MGLPHPAADSPSLATPYGGHPPRNGEGSRSIDCKKAWPILPPGQGVTKQYFVGPLRLALQMLYIEIERVEPLNS